MIYVLNASPTILKFGTTGMLSSITILSGVSAFVLEKSSLTVVLKGVSSTVSSFAKTLWPTIL